MSKFPRLGIPVMAGLCSLEDAARPGYSVDENVSFLLRYAWVEKRLMEMFVAWICSTPEWEIKEAFSLHCWQAAEHATALRDRISELRHPAPPMDRPPDAALERFLHEVVWSADTSERLVAVYRVILPALLDAYRAHVTQSNRLVDHPTYRALRLPMLETEEAIAWGEGALNALVKTPADRERAGAWESHLRAYLAAARGIRGDAEPASGQLPASRATGEYKPDLVPQRDRRFHGQSNFIFPPHEVYRAEGVPDEEKVLALMCKRTLEMDVPEAMSHMILGAKDVPWEFYRDMTRQLWDEARHAMIGESYFESIGVDWSKIPLHIGFSLGINQALTPLEGHTWLFTIEHNLMAANTGKRYEWETARKTDDTLAVLFQDYDWADEVVHSKFGQKWLKRMTGMTIEQVKEMGMASYQKTLDLLKDHVREPQVNWWPQFMQDVLGVETAVAHYKTDPGASQAKPERIESG